VGDRVEIRVVFGPGCGGRSALDLLVTRGTPLRALLPELGVFVEGTALWWDGEPVPSDFPVTQRGRLEVVGTFSGG
jgi:sulfur carrier protein ThiS